MEWCWIAAIIYGGLWVIALPGLAACVLSSKISQQEERCRQDRQKEIV